MLTMISNQTTRSVLMFLITVLERGCRFHAFPKIIKKRRGGARGGGHFLKKILSVSPNFGLKKNQHFENKGCISEGSAIFKLK